MLFLTTPSFSRLRLSRRYFGMANLVTPFLHFQPDLIPNFTGQAELGCCASGQTGWIGKRPMQALRDAWENGTGVPLRLRFSADGDDISEQLTRFPDIENGLRLLPGDIDPGLAHCFHCERIQHTGLEAGALRFKLVSTKMIEPGFSHLAASAVMNADEQDL